MWPSRHLEALSHFFFFFRSVFPGEETRANKNESVTLEMREKAVWELGYRCIAVDPGWKYKETTQTEWTGRKDDALFISSPKFPGASSWRKPAADTYLPALPFPQQFLRNGLFFASFYLTLGEGDHPTSHTAAVVSTSAWFLHRRVGDHMVENSLCRIR